MNARDRAASNGQAGPSPRQRPAQSARGAYQRPESTELLTCARPDCGANYLNDGPGRQAHRAVFGHVPKAPQQPRAPRRSR
jgi:hypothetical protein